MAEIQISKDKGLIDIPYVHEFLTNAYWARGRTLDEVACSMYNCTCYGVYIANRQIGFARILTDHVVFAYIMDVFIDPSFRGQGYSKQLLEAIHKDADLSDVKTWYLKTGDAHDLYRQYEYEALKNVDVWMERRKDKGVKDPNRI